MDVHTGSENKVTGVSPYSPCVGKKNIKIKQNITYIYIYIDKEPASRSGKIKCPRKVGPHMTTKSNSKIWSDHDFIQEWQTCTSLITNSEISSLVQKWNTPKSNRLQFPSHFSQSGHLWSNNPIFEPKSGWDLALLAVSLFSTTFFFCSSRASEEIAEIAYCLCFMENTGLSPPIPLALEDWAPQPQQRLWLCFPGRCACPQAPCFAEDSGALPPLGPIQPFKWYHIMSYHSILWPKGQSSSWQYQKGTPTTLSGKCWTNFYVWLTDELSSWTHKFGPVKPSKLVPFSMVQNPCWPARCGSVGTLLQLPNYNFPYRTLPQLKGPISQLALKHRSHGPITWQFTSNMSRSITKTSTIHLKIINNPSKLHSKLQKSIKTPAKIPWAPWGFCFDPGLAWSLSLVATSSS